MLILKFKILAAGAIVAAPLSFGVALHPNATATFTEPPVTTLRAGTVTYRPAGDYVRASRPATAAFEKRTVSRGLTIMTRQVTASEYRQCVEARACAPADARPAAAIDDGQAPIAGVSWNDAQAYARWLSQRSGRHYRLPTDSEWAFAAGSRFRDEGWPDTDSADPAQRWIARYEAEAQEQVDSALRPSGAFGRNENGLDDIAGNVWEWTDTCFVRVSVDEHGRRVSETANCGVRVVEGRHRTYVTDFIRDARAGGCAVGTPPANLGFRLVRED
jgi:formylglycine-generating enzyme required for sulfatase activity